MSVTEEALVAYYDTRAQAERRRAVATGSAAKPIDSLHRELEARSQDLYRERLGNLGNLAVGEVGVGGGDFVRYAFQQNARAMVLVDISRERLDALSQQLALPLNGRAKLIVANAQRLDGVDDGELDLLVAKEVIEHLIDHRPFLEECHRVLRPGGRLYLTTPNRHCIDLWPRIAFGRLFPRSKRRGSDLVRELFGHLFDYLTSEEVARLADVLPAGYKEHIHEFTPRELADTLRAHGLRPMRAWGTPPQMFYHELRPVARRLLPAWNRADRLSYFLGDNLRVIAERPL